MPNKYLEMLDRIETKTNDDDFCANGGYDVEQNKNYFQSIGVSSQYSNNNIEDVFSDIIKDGTFIALTIDCETNEIDYVSYLDNEDTDVRQIILDSLTSDEIELYHSKCKAVINKAIDVFEKKCRDAHNRHVDRFGGEYI